MADAPLFDDAHALVIGVPPGRLDAEDIASVLRDPERCAYPAARVRTLLDGEASRDAIYAGLDAIARDATEESTAFLYFSGHGVRARGTDSYYLVPADGVRTSHDELKRTAISNAELSARLRAIKASRLTVVLDCCRASEIADVEISAEAVAPLAHGRGRVVLAASRDSAYKVDDRNSAFTHHLLAGLRGGAEAAGGVIRVCDLFRYVQARFADQPLPQQPIFKAELEEDYPIARHRGRTVELPAAPQDGFAYDAFLSYCADDEEDRAWVEDVAVPYLEGRLGLQLCLEHRDFIIGEPLLSEAARAVRESRYTVAVLTPSYMSGPFAQYQRMLGAHQAMEAGAPRMVPLQRRTCELALEDRMTAILDVRRDKEVEPGLQRLALQLRRAPKSRLSPRVGAAN